MNADAWFELSSPDTEALPVVESVKPAGVVKFADHVHEDARAQFQEAWHAACRRPIVLAADLEYQHRAELAEIDLPPHPLAAPAWRPDWAAIRVWLSGTAQLALGVSLGYLAVLVLLVVLR